MECTKTTGSRLCRKLAHAPSRPRLPPSAAAAARTRCAQARRSRRATLRSSADARVLASVQGPCESEHSRRHARMAELCGPKGGQSKRAGQGRGGQLRLVWGLSGMPADEQEGQGPEQWRSDGVHTLNRRKPSKNGIEPLTFQIVAVP